jgi:hypothetical protein
VRPVEIGTGEECCEAERVRTGVMVGERRVGTYGARGAVSFIFAVDGLRRKSSRDVERRRCIALSFCAGRGKNLPPQAEARLTSAQTKLEATLSVE